jgi:hypothetical protein
MKKTGGAKGNERLTEALGVVLLVLLALMALTALDLRAYVNVHMFLGLALLPAVSLKLASTSWRAARYYTGSAAYRSLGPPQIVLRLLAPLLVAATITLFGSGVAFLVTDRGRGLILTVHAASFVVWGATIALHVLAYLPRVLRDGFADWQRRRPLAGARARRLLVVGCVLAGLAVASATYPLQNSWLAHHRRNGPEHRSSVPAPPSAANRGPAVFTEVTNAPMRRALAPVITSQLVAKLLHTPTVAVAQERR